MPPSKVPENPQAAMLKALQAAQKRAGGSTMFGPASEVIPENAADYVSTGFPQLDIGVLVNGGLPLGCMVEIFGKPSGGKTLVGLRTIAQAQKKGYPCALIDAERGLGNLAGKRWMQTNGVDLQYLHYSWENIAEFAMKEAIERLKDGFKLVMLDSIGALIPESESYENLKTKSGAKSKEEWAKPGVGTLARSISSGVKQLSGYAAEYGALIIVVNQVREKIGSMSYGDSKSTPGGFALEHQCGMRIQVERVNYIKQGEEPIGVDSKVACRKSKYCPPGRITGNNYPNLSFYFDGRPVPMLSALTSIAVNLGIITRPNMQTYVYQSQSGQTVQQRGLDNMVAALGEAGLEPELNTVVTLASRERAYAHGKEDEDMDPNLVQRDDDYESVVSIDGTDDGGGDVLDFSGR